MYYQLPRQAFGKKWKISVGIFVVIISLLMMSSLNEVCGQDSKFYSMRFTKSLGDSLARLDKFDHFIFQPANPSRSGFIFGRDNVIMLYVRACDAEGKAIDEKSTRLAINKKDDYAHFENLLFLASYKITKSTWETVYSKIDSFNYLKFIPIGPRYSEPVPQNTVYPSYVTYKIIAFSEGNKLLKIPANNSLFDDPDYLKPSPPSRRELEKKQ